MQTFQLMLFLFPVSASAGVLVRLIGRRLGRDRMIWFSILGTQPFALALQFASLFWISVLTVWIELVAAIARNFLFFAMDLVPNHVGLRWTVLRAHSRVAWPCPL
ncbi:hypothetical protein [Alsobacter sp. SYSU BS001988]